jgi:hypothetical protein
VYCLLYVGRYYRRIELSGSVREEEDFLTRYCTFSRRVLLRAMYVVAGVRKDTPPPDMWEERDSTFSSAV